MLDPILLISTEIKIIINIHATLTDEIVIWFKLNQHFWSNARNIQRNTT